MGEQHIRFRLRLPQNETVLNAIAFSAVQYGWDSVQGAVRIVFRLDVNEFRGQQSLQLMIEFLEPAP